MSVISTTAPISIENLKLFFADKSTTYVIDYDNSSLQGQRLLTYLGNLDIPCDISAFDPTNASHAELLGDYLKTQSLVNIPALEQATIDCLFEYKHITDTTHYRDFISKHEDDIAEWVCRLDSLTLYNMWCIESDDCKQWVKQHPEDGADATSHVNFVKLLKYEHFYVYFSAVNQSNLKNYTTLFNEYCFKGKNLFEFWGVAQNPMFVLTWAIASDSIRAADYAQCLSDTQHELVAQQTL